MAGTDSKHPTVVEEEATPIETPKGKKMESKIEELLFERIGEIKESISNRISELREDIMELHADVRAIQNAQQQHGIAVAQLQVQFATLQVQHEQHQHHCEIRFDGQGKRIEELGKLADGKEISQVHIRPLIETPPIVDLSGLSRLRTDTGVEKRLEKIEKISAEDIKFQARLGGAWKAIVIAAGAAVVIYSAVISTYSTMRHSQGNEPKNVVVTIDQIVKAIQSTKDNSNAASFPVPSFVQLPAVDAGEEPPLEPQFVGKPTRKIVKAK